MLLYCYEAARQEALAGVGGERGVGAAVNPWRTPAAAAVLGEPAVAPRSATADDGGALRLTLAASTMSASEIPVPQALVGGEGVSDASCESPAVRRSSKPPQPVIGDCGGTGSAHSSPLQSEFEDGSRGGDGTASGFAEEAVGDDADERLTADPAEASCIVTPGKHAVPALEAKTGAGGSTLRGGDPRRRRYHLLPFSPFRESEVVSFVSVVSVGQYLHPPFFRIASQLHPSSSC